MILPRHRCLPIHRVPMGKHVDSLCRAFVRHSWLVIYLILWMVTGCALVVIDPRYYVMPDGRLPEGLPVLGSGLCERLVSSGTLGAIVSFPLTVGVALTRRLVRQRRSTPSDKAE